MSRPAAPGSCRVCSRGSRGSRKGPCRRADRTARDPYYGGFTGGSKNFGVWFCVSQHFHRGPFIGAGHPSIFFPSIFLFFFFEPALVPPPARLNLFGL